MQRLGAELVGNIALVDRHNNYTSVLTILHWMSTGRKESPWSLPKAGVSDRDILEVDRYGLILKKYLDRGCFQGLQAELVQHGAVEIRPFLVKVDRLGNKLFTFFSGRVKAQPERRKFWVKVFKFYLLFAIWVVSPVVLLFYVLVTPLYYKKRREQIKYHQGI